MTNIRRPDEEVVDTTRSARLPTQDDSSSESSLQLRSALNRVQELLVLSMLMFDHHHVDEVLQVLRHSVRSVTGCELVHVAFRRSHQWTSWPRPGHAAPDTRLGQHPLLEEAAGGWRCTTPVAALSGPPGHLVLSSADEPDAQQLYVIERLGHLLGAALGDAELHERDLLHASELNRANEELASTVAALRHREIVQDAFTSLAGGGAEAEVAASLSRLTGRTVVVRDGFGHETTRVEAGAESLPTVTGLPRRTSEALTRKGTTLVASIGGGRVGLGTIELECLIDDDGREGDARFALQYASTALGLLQAHEQALGEMENRLSRDLIEDLIDGVTPDRAAVARSRAQGHDLRVPHDVIIVAWRSTKETDDNWNRDIELTRQALARQGLPCLVAHRQGMVVVLSHQGVDINRIYEDLSRSFGVPSGQVALGEPAIAPHEIPRAYEQARRALTARQQSSIPQGATAYADLGVDRILAIEGNAAEVKSLVSNWLGDLLEYDDKHGAELVLTLAAYLDQGGRYAETAQVLSIHRNTLRYRLGRIAQISGHDLADVESRLNLHLATRAWRLHSAHPASNGDP